MDSMDGPSIRFSFVLLLWLIVLRKKHVPHTFWVEPRQETLSNYVVWIVWITIEKMHHRKYRKFYKMNLEAFESLVWILTPYLKSNCVNKVQPLLKIRKIVTLVIYRFIHGTSPNHIVDHLKVGCSTTRKYINIVCEIFH